MTEHIAEHRRRAMTAMTYYQRLHDQSMSDSEAITALLVDIMHLADVTPLGINMDRVISQARDQHLAEAPNTVPGVRNPGK